MPFLNKKPIGQQVPDYTRKPNSSLPQPKPKKDETFFKGRSQVSRYEIDRFFRNPKVRYDLKRELHLPLRDEKKLNEEIADIKKMIVDHYGKGFVDAAEAKKSVWLEQWKLKREKRVPPKNWKEKKERRVEEKEYQFLKKKFGVK